MLVAKLPLGYKANGIACGIKKSGKPDLGLIISQLPAVGCGLFTANKVVSGSVKFCRQNLSQPGRFKAIIVNSGNANCFSRQDSLGNAHKVAAALARFLKIKKKEVLFASTGIIGRDLPVARIKQAIPGLVKGLSKSGLTRMARAIITTDAFIKLSSTSLYIGKRKVTICGLAKGAGMIAPNLATMLCFILTDADITRPALKKALAKAVDSSFNCISVDGCMSTNDSLLIMSNAAAGNPKIQPGSRDFNKFSYRLSRVCLNLAKMIVRNAEGASKFIQIKVSGAKTYQEAKQAALSIANSNLFKTAMFGSNKNLGRVVAAIGAGGIEVKEKALSINISPLNKQDISLRVSLGRGAACATVYSSDLTPQYVKINARYN